ncbi:DUF1054 family protein [Alloscardovia sp. HMSC034E08]|uniref:DUF1054 family protein n=1 Tax=Alloscardovia sp. HMSC034E08 TaxID=1739413 RepID=UPI0008D536F5|nr:DUF1054 family protein [Alloscardovia sp. HMSC034E08]OFQ99748.1 hypothetical protein HMPREF2909_05980 [Alloscardovia sp. HMSC034E08]
MRASFEPLAQVDGERFFERVARVKKAEWIIGRVVQPGSTVLAGDNSTEQWLLETVDALLPFYERAISFYE